MPSIVIDEEAGTLSLVDVTITFPYSTDFVQTRVGTIILTLDGALASFPMAIEGAGGPPSPPSAVDVTIIAHDATPADPVVTIVDPGGPGEPAVWTLEIEIPRGEPGEPGAFNILDGDDIDGTVTAGYVMAKKVGESKVIFVPQPYGDMYWPGAIAATAWSNTSPRLLASVTVPAKPYAWRPVVSGQVVVTGSVDTRVDLVARLNDQDTGNQVGRALGLAGAAPPPLIFSFGPPAGSSSGYGKVAAGADATIYFRAEQQAASSNNWSTPAAASGTFFSVLVVPVP